MLSAQFVYKDEAKANLRGKLGVVIGMLLVVGLINLVFSVIDDALNPGLLSITFSIINSVLGALFAYSFMHTYILIANDKVPDFSECFSSGFQENPTRTILMVLIEGIFLALWAAIYLIPVLIIVGSTWSLAPFLWLSPLLIPFFIKVYAYAMSMFLINQQSLLSPLDAITESRSLMDGYKKDIFLLDLSFIGWYLLSILTFGLLLLYVIPYHQTTRVLCFMDIYGKKQTPRYSSTPAPDPLETL